MRNVITAAALAALLILGACGGKADDGSASARTTAQPGPDTTAPAIGVPDVAVDYLGLLASGTVTDISRMADLAADGSPAELYAQYHLASSRYSLGSPSTSDVKDDQVEQCVDGTSTADETEPQCTMFGDFETDGDGLLVTFSTDGSPITDRLRAGDPAGVTDGEVTGRVLTAYVTSAGDLFVAVDVTNSRPGVIRVDDCSATYVGPDGRQVGQVCVSQHPAVQPGATTSVVFLVEQAPLGGTLTVSVSAERQPSSGDFHTDVVLNLLAPA